MKKLKKQNEDIWQWQRSKKKKTSPFRFREILLLAQEKGMRRFHVIGDFKNLKNNKYMSNAPPKKQGMKQTNPKNPKNLAHPTTLFLHSHLYKVGGPVPLINGVMTPIARPI